MTEISLDEIYMSYAFNDVLKGFSFKINIGERVGLIGPNGTGKTTLLRLIIKEEIPSKGTISVRKSSSIGYLRQIPPLEADGVLASDVYLRGIRELLEMKEELEILESNMSHHENSIKKYTKLREIFELKGGYEINKRVNTIKNVFKLSEELMNREYNKLSGGEKTIINLASLVLSEPDILLLDEPTNHLDIDTLEWLEDFLKNYKGTVLIISHDRYFLDRVITKIVSIDEGKEDIYFGNYSYYLDESEKRFLAEFQAYKNQQKEIKALKEAIERLKMWGQKSDNPLTFKRMHAIEKRLEKMDVIDKPREKKKLPIRFNEGKRSSNHVIDIEGLNLSIGDNELLVNSKMSLMYKDRLCLMGKNGTGKTTLIKAILDNNREEIKIASNTLIGYIPQEVRFDDESLTIYEHMRAIFIGSEEELRSKLFQFYFGSETIGKKLKTLSGGEKVRIKLLELIIKNSNLLILDEPTNHIDVETKELLEESLLDFEGTILFISHDRYFINKIATKIVRIEDKKLVSYDGNYDDIKDKKIIKEEIVKEEKQVIINGSNRLNSYLNDSKVSEISDGIYKLKKNSRVFLLKVKDHLSEESMRMDYLEGKLLIPKKMFYEKYNNKSYILTESLKGNPLNSEYFINHPEEGIKIIIEAFNAIYSIDYSDCIFDEMIDTKIKRIENTINLELPIEEETYKKEFINKKAMVNYLKGNKQKSVIGFTLGNMSLDNIYAFNNSFSGISDVSECGISDIYYDLVSIDSSIEKYYGVKYVGMFYNELGIEKEEAKSKYYKLLNYLKNKTK